MKYVAYTRKSKSKKIKNSEGKWILEEDPLSHDVQISDIKKYTGDAELIVFSESDVSRDDTINNRPILLDAINCVEEGDVLIVWKSNRLVANQVVLTNLKFQIKKKGATIYSLNEPGLFKEGPMADLMDQMAIAFNQFEVANLRHNITKALQRKKERGERVGYIPYGYRLDGSKYLVPDDIEQHTLILMDELYFSKQCTYRGVAEFLNTEEILNRAGHQWSHTSVFRILKNRHRHAEAYLVPEVAAQV